MNFYISDLHFGHKNIIRFDNRPYSSIEEMDHALINNWNKVVTDEDTVYILGDISWYNKDKTLKIIKSLKGKKVLIKGNHDKIDNELSKEFVKIRDYLEIYDSDTKVILCHYPIPFWNGQFRDSVHLYGHVHITHQWNVCENLKAELKRLQDLPMRMFNVGCMMEYMNYTPQTLKTILNSETMSENKGGD